MMAAALRNSQGDLRRIERAQKWLAAVKVDPDLKKVSAEDYAAALRVCFRSVFPELFSAEQSPTVAEMGSALNAKRAETALAIVNAGRKARNEPPVDSIVIPFFRTKET